LRAESAPCSSPIWASERCGAARAASRSQQSESETGRSRRRDGGRRVGVVDGLALNLEQACPRRARFGQTSSTGCGAVALELPPLHSARKDLPLLVTCCCGGACSNLLGLPSLAFYYVLAVRHAVPCNVRELRNVLERALALSLRRRPLVRTADAVVGCGRTLRRPRGRTAPPFRKRRRVGHAFEAGNLAS